MSHLIRINLFEWSGYTNIGEKVSGQSIGEKEADIHSQLKEQGIQVFEVSFRPLSKFEQWRYQPKRKDIFIFTNQFATLLNTGMSILPALKLLISNQEKIGMKILIFSIHQKLEEGYSLAEAFRNQHILFDNFFCDLIITGEQTGRLAEMFIRITNYQEKNEQLRRKTIRAMIYPFMIFSVAFVLTLLMMTLVIPEFEQMFRGFNADLPWLTAKLIELSNWVLRYWLLLLILPCALIAYLRYRLKHCLSFRLTWSIWLLKIPIFGKILTKVSMAKFSRTLATALTSGIPIAQALITSASTASNLYYQQAFHKVNTLVASGASVHVAIKSCKVFPSMMQQMIMIGESSGQLDDILAKIASIYEAEVDNIVDNLGQLLEPFILIILGVIVGTLVVALYLPIFNLVTVF